MTESTTDIPAHGNLQNGNDPEKEAWMTAFFIENHLDYFTYPDHAASPEQVRFMVYTETGQRYYPCSDRMFSIIMARRPSNHLKQKYAVALKRILDLVDSQIEDPWEGAYLKSLITIKHQHETRDGIMIPSRVQKRLMAIFQKRTQIEDPYLIEKTVRNRRAGQRLASETFHKALNHVNEKDLKNPPPTLAEIKRLVSYLELRRLLKLCAANELWEEVSESSFAEERYREMFHCRLVGDGVTRFFDAIGLSPGTWHTEISRKKILWLADESGEILVDFQIIRALIRLGHKVILAFKDGPLFTKADFYDAQDDAVLQQELNDAMVISDPRMTKNDLLKTLKSDHSLFVLSDGTKENVNLLLVSTTFARLFKEVDVVLSRGHDQQRRFFTTQFRFTQDIINITAEGQNTVAIRFKPRHPAVIKFSHADLENKAQEIIDRMAEAAAQGMSVMFYSGIIGSIPGKIDMAKKIMSVFVDHLRQQYTGTFIINPSEYFEPGMDADDLMYMWEIVQRSGLIDIWRFQTYGDIAQAFEIMKGKVPPEWVGKDATYSTGCTKEMMIAMDVQRINPEMQIIGPSKEKFFRRSEYGVGKMYDARLRTGGDG